MNVVVAGASGFLGSPLAAALQRDGHSVVRLTRAAGDGQRVVQWTPNGASGPWARVVDGAGAVVNLAGESIAGKRWSAARKEALRSSRLLSTRSLTAAMQGAARPPGVFISSSAVGYYGDRGDEILTEESPPGDGFLATLAAEWEAEALRAGSPRLRVTLVRTGLVLARDGGALAKMLTPFRLGLGGRLGDGRQYMSWIDRDDWVALMQWIMKTEAAGGPINATSPNPVTNAEFTRALGRALRRPAALPAPRAALRLAMGEMADALLFSSQRVAPARALALGFRFARPALDAALAAALE
jgi:uncharacterized protein (TIGR01777 family)